MTYDDRMPPADNDAEQAVLGAMMLSKDAVADVVERLDGADFYRPAHEVIYDTIVALFASGEPTDPVMVANTLSATKAGNGQNGLAHVGGAPYLHDLMQAVPHAANAGYYADIVREKAILRRIATAGTRMIQWAYDGADAAAEVMDRAQMELYAAAPARAAQDYRAVGDLVAESLDEVQAAAERGGQAVGIPTGFYDLDELLGGLAPGQMVVVAGRPASGKSTLATDFCRAASIHNGIPSVLFSLEMNRHEIVLRLLSAEAKVTLSNLRTGALSDREWSLLAGVLGRVADAPLYVDDSPNMTMTEIRAKARRLHHECGGLGLIVVDYLQLMSSGQRVENRQVEVSEFSRQIKLLAKELGCPVVALSQLNRGPEQRSNKRPMLSDLRESGAIEQDADIVILVHREDMYELESSRPGEADLIVAKHRNGPTRDIAVAAQLHYSRFADLARG